MIDQVAEFARWLPAWCDPKTGLPLTYRHYVYGMAYIRRAQAREQLRVFDAMNMSQAVGDAAREWRRNRSIEAGYD